MTPIVGLSEEVVRQISAIKREPDWMLDIRLDAYREFCRLPLPNIHPLVNSFNFDELYYYQPTLDNPVDRWNKIPNHIKTVYDQLGLPKAEQRYLAGAQVQQNSSMIYERIKKRWQDKGVIFTDTDTAVQQYPDLVRKYFGKLVDYHGNKFAALNTAVWSGGSFIYVKAGVRIPIPLQAYYRINISNLGQFERSLIIVENDSSLQYVEGCSAPIFKQDSLHNSVVEVYVGQNSRMRYTAVQNWSTNVLNIVNSKMSVADGGVGEWIDANIGSKLTKKCPTIELIGHHSIADIMSLSMAKSNQLQDTGGRVIHVGNHTASTITSKSVSFDNGVSTYRGDIIVKDGASNAKSSTRCDSLLMDNNSIANTYPQSQISRDDAIINHEASTGCISKAQLFYLMSRGLDESSATNLIVNGFVEPIIRQLPMEYASELNRLLELSTEGAIG